MPSATAGQPSRWPRRLGVAALAMLAALVLIQLVPFGHQHTNPAVQAEPLWDSPATRALAVRACFACHSNQTSWPAYSNLAPVSWLVQRDVNDGRARLNFSQWGQPQRAARRAGRAVQEAKMPPNYYQWLHGEAQLTDAERQQLAQGLTATFAQSPPGATAR